MRGNYDIVDKSVANNRSPDDRISRTMNLTPSTISVETGAREMDEGKRLAQVFCAIKYKIPEGGNPNVDKRPMVRKVLGYCNKLDFKPSTAKKVEHICLWILQILNSAGVGGMNVSEIFENAFDNRKSFEPKEIAESMEFLTEEEYIYKLGIGKVKNYDLMNEKLRIGVAIQKATGHGAECAYCFHEFLRHRGAAADVARGAAADPMNSPVYITVCGHIICGRCICYRSRPIVPNMNALYRRKYPYVASDYAGMACPACNVAYSWSQLYNF
ncbi:unnamed protein product [Oikopleura dioica]|uniref:RING-type domain-containing protein n=1 Tax=Oikopleura dioica TaxID=34765 RepID=E4X633_OIKDI|nr:unnamed protein product [Oikopleura dioica]